MHDVNLLEQSVGWLARNIPGSTQIFRQYQMDFCCGGQQMLGDALEDRNLAPEPVLAQLRALQQDGSDEVDWAAVPRSRLIHHILTRYHDRHRQQLPELILMARRVEQVHGNKPECPNGLTQHLKYMAGELEAHMRKEELVLFPMLQTHASPAQLNAPISVMRHEHDDHGLALNTIESLTDNITVPKGACNTWRALYTSLAQLRDDLMQHIHLENNILFVDDQGSYEQS